jgi:dephospho-CoA kinase
MGVSRWENKYVIGLTGNIAVGKSYVRQMLQHLGAYPIDADQLTHRAMAPGAPAYKPVVEMFGRFILDEENRINRTRLGAIAFAVPDAMAALETIIHPVVRQAVGIFITNAKQPVIVIEAIKLLEGDLVNAVDSVWVVDASPEMQMRRLVEKRRMSPEDARRRIMAQRPQSEKLQRANVVIANNGNAEETWRQVQAAWEGVQRALNPAPTAPPAAASRSTTTLKPLSVSSGRPIAPAEAAPPAPAAAPSGEAKPALDPKTPLTIKRGMPGNAEAIAGFVSRVSGRQVGRMDIMIAFGQKSFLLAMGKDDALVGVVGWQVENLITRIDEFHTAPDPTRLEILTTLIAAAEEASKDLQSEVSFVVLPRSLGTDLKTALVRHGYKPLNMEETRFPAWREAAREMLAIPDADVMIKQLRAERVVNPI